MSFSFGPELNAFFQCERGAYSVITNDEFNKSQVTFVGPEQELAENFFGNRLDGHRGSIDDMIATGIDPEFSFRIHPTGEIKRLTVAYKKGRPNELRYYARKDTFKPLPGEYWCIFQRGTEIWLGSFSEWLLQAILRGSIGPAPRNEILEQETDAYQLILNTTEPQKIASTTLQWKRNPKIAANALQHYGRGCEVHPEYPTFLSRGTGLVFVEAHHLVPMKLQGQFGDIQLDSVDNICILNPLSHRKLHHGRLQDIEKDLNRLMSNRSELLARLGLQRFDILEMYQ
jgi:5-methylcytosine-specific restriction enzyme A